MPIQVMMTMNLLMNIIIRSFKKLIKKKNLKHNQNQLLNIKESLKMHLSYKQKLNLMNLPIKLKNKKLQQINTLKINKKIQISIKIR